MSKFPCLPAFNTLTRREPQATPYWRRRACAAAAAVAAALALPAHAASSAWQGRITVHAQTGSACAPEAIGEPLAVQAVIDLGEEGEAASTDAAPVRGLVWGAMLPAELSGPTLSALNVRWVSPAVPAAARQGHGSRLKRDGQRIHGAWREVASPDAQVGACFWTDASIELSRVPDAGQAAALARGARQQAFWDALAALRPAAGAAPDAAPEPAARAAVDQAVRRLLAAAEADTATTSALLKTIDNLALGGQRGLAREWLALLPPWLEQVARADAVTAAGYAMQAGATARMLRLAPLADTMYRQALTTLDETRPDDQFTIAALLSARGTLLLRGRRVQEAQAVFERALAVERRLTPGPSAGVAMASHNLARAWAAGGQGGRAIALLRDALDELAANASATEPPEPQWTDLLRDTLERIQAERPQSAA
jgi:tetratricopeptide (TPR) repeat protein